MTDETLNGTVLAISELLKIHLPKYKSWKNKTHFVINVLRRAEKNAPKGFTRIVQIKGAAIFTSLEKNK
jgi:hypothetical protein